MEEVLNIIQTFLLLMYHVNVAGGLDQSDEQLATTKSSNLYVELNVYINGSDWGNAGREQKDIHHFILLIGVLIYFIYIYIYMSYNVIYIYYIKKIYLLPDKTEEDDVFHKNPCTL